MQIKIFTLPIYSSERSEDELNKFLRSHRILQTERHFCPDNGGYWTILVEYLDNDSVANVLPASRKDHKDYAKELKEEELSRYDNFKKIRRKLATERNMPAYLIFTNEELAILAKMPILGHTGTGVLSGYADLMMEKLIPVRRTSCWILAPYSFASLMISSLRSRLYN